MRKEKNKFGSFPEMLTLGLVQPSFVSVEKNKQVLSA
jgi:hypothetical protein